MIAGISSTSTMESTPNLDPTLGMGGVEGVAKAALGGQSGQQRQDSGAQAQNVSDSLHLSTEAQQQLAKLQERDREVRSHEQAHVAAGGPHVTSGASYKYTRGPDGQQYATGGSVSIDTSSVNGDPEATVEKARTVRRAALAPGNPSAQDQNVAASAANMEMKAKMEKASAAYQAMQNQGAGLSPHRGGLAVAV